FCFFSQNLYAGEFDNPGKIESNNSLKKIADLEFLGAWANGPSYTVARSGDFIYFGTGGYFNVADISDPVNPQITAKIISGGVINEIVIKDNYAYLAAGEAGLIVFDITDSQNPVEVSNSSDWYSGYAKELAIEGNKLYLASSETEIFVFNIIDPGLPGKDNTIDLSSVDKMKITNIEASGDILYIACMYSPHMLIYDVNDPGDPVLLSELGQLDPNSLTYDMAVAGNYIYLGDNKGLGIIEISDPGNPDFLGFTNLGYFENLKTVKLVDTLLYVMGDFSHILIYDLSDPESPVNIFSYRFNDVMPTDYAFPYDVVVRDTFAYTAHGTDGLRGLDFSDPENPVEYDIFDAAHQTRDIVVENSIAYLANDEIGLILLDVSDTANPEEISRLEEISGVLKLAVHKGFVYLADYNNGFYVIDATTPSNLVVGSQFLSDYNVNDIIVKDNYAYVAHGGGITIFDVSDPGNPLEVGFTDFTQYSARLEKNGDYLYSLSSSGTAAELDIFDISDPTNLIHKGTQSITGDFGIDLAVNDENAFVLTQGQFQVFSMSDPYHLSDQGTYTIDPDPIETAITGDIILNGDHLLLSDNRGIFRIYDISNPAVPAELYAVNTPGSVYSININTQEIYLADGKCGFSIYFWDLISNITEQIYHPVSLKLLPNYPNPFNPVTVIPYEIPESSQVVLQVFDILGKKVATIVNAYQNAGRHEVSFDASDLSSGIYYYTIKSNAGIKTSKMILLK
ncbi:MAG: T9SS type A sorting domain-containing protein, partial [Calditrichaceae bacterium]